MADSSVIQEFLVSLGFKVDQTSQKKMTDSIDGIGKQLQGLATTLATTLLATETFAAGIASSLDNLYFASKRTGASVQEIKSYGFAVSQLGGTAAGAQQSLENLADFQRNTPGANGILAGLGVKPEDLKDAEKILTDLAPKFQALTANGQGAYAQYLMRFLGIDRNTGLAMLDPSFGAKQNEYNNMLKGSGIDLQSLTNTNHEFENQLKTLGASFELLAFRIERDLVAPMAQFNALVLQLTGSKMSDASVAGGLAGAAALGGGTLSKLPFIGGAAGAVSRLGGVGFLASLPWMAGDAGDAIGRWLNANPDNAASNFIRDNQQDALNDNIKRSNNNPGNLRSWGKNTTRNGFAVFDSPELGLNALAKQLLLYKGRGIDTLSGIIKTYAPSSENNTAAYIQDMVSRTGYAANSHLDLNNTDTLYNVMRNIIIHEGNSKGINGRMVSDAAKSATIHQTNNITVPASSNPQMMATAIASQVANQTRNTISAIQ